MHSQPATVSWRRDARGNLLIDDSRRTLAVVNPFGLMDWLDCGDLDPGLGRLEFGHEVHLSGCRGVQVQLVPPVMLEGRLDLLRITIDAHLADGQVVVTATADSGSEGWNCVATATRQADGAWAIAMRLTRHGAAVPAGTNLEITDIHPGEAGRGFLTARTKRFTHIVLADSTRGESYANQHPWHCGDRLYGTRWQVATSGMYVGGPGDGLELVAERSNADLFWAICDMYYDLHLFARLDAPLASGAVIDLAAALRRVPAPAALARLAVATLMPGPVRDNGPRIEEGHNALTESINTAQPDEAHHFRPDGAARTWARQGGRDGGGRLLLQGPSDTRWEMGPPLHLRPGEALTVSAWVRGGAVRLQADAWTWQWPTQPGAALSHGRTDRGHGRHSASASNAWQRITVVLPAPAADEVEVTAALQFILEGEGQVEICAIDVISKP